MLVRKRFKIMGKQDVIYVIKSCTKTNNVGQIKELIQIIKR